MVSNYVAVCPSKAYFNCRWTDVNELLANSSNTMSFEDANLLLGEFYIVIGVAFVVKLILKSLINY